MDKASMLNIVKELAFDDKQTVYKVIFPRKSGHNEELVVA